MKKQSETPQFEFTIIAGTLKGKRIVAPDLGITRPPLSRLRKSIFDFLKPFLEDARYLDLFSGTGSYLFEAVSRGVATAVGVELHPALAAAINAQAEQFNIADRLRCIEADVRWAVPSLADTGEQFDIIMVAPPQYHGWIDRTLEIIRRTTIATPDTLILCQHDTSEVKHLRLEGFEILQRRKYGNTTFTALRMEKRG